MTCKGADSFTTAERDAHALPVSMYSLGRVERPRLVALVHATCQRNTANLSGFAPDLLTISDRQPLRRRATWSVEGAREKEGQVKM